jgi:hypothetical protein
MIIPEDSSILAFYLDLQAGGINEAKLTIKTLFIDGYNLLLKPFQRGEPRRAFFSIPIRNFHWLSQPEIYRHDWDTQNHTNSAMACLECVETFERATDVKRALQQHCEAKWNDMLKKITWASSHRNGTHAHQEKKKETMSMGDKTMRLRKWRWGKKFKKSSKSIGNFGFRGFSIV